MILSRCRKAVDTLAPPLGRQYRLLRDATNRRRSIPTKYGFTLAGDPSMTNPDWETNEVQAFLELLQNHDAVLDIGANVGFYSCLAASRGIHTVAFEPSSRNLASSIETCGRTAFWMSKSFRWVWRQRAALAKSTVLAVSRLWCLVGRKQAVRSPAWCRSLLLTALQACVFAVRNCLSKPT